jgi:hypothetical protein
LYLPPGTGAYFLAGTTTTGHWARCSTADRAWRRKAQYMSPRPQLFFSLLPTREIAPTAGASVSQSPIVTTIAVR